VLALLNVTHLEGVGRRAEGEEASTSLVFCLLPRARMRADKLEGLDPSSLEYLVCAEKLSLGETDWISISRFRDCCAANSIPRAGMPSESTAAMLTPAKGT
jgi:hypothetical protein